MAVVIEPGLPNADSYATAAELVLRVLAPAGVPVLYTANATR